MKPVWHSYNGVIFYYVYGSIVKMKYINVLPTFSGWMMDWIISCWASAALDDDAIIRTAALDKRIRKPSWKDDIISGRSIKSYSVYWKNCGQTECW